MLCGCAALRFSAWLDLDQDSRSGRCHADKVMSTRVALFVLGLIAVSALLLQPICEASEQHPALAHSIEGDSCCSMVAPALRTAPLANAPSIPVAAPAVGHPVFRPHVVIHNALPAAAPPLVLSYHVRSARIQR